MLLAARGWRGVLPGLCREREQAVEVEMRFEVPGEAVQSRLDLPRRSRAEARRASRASKGGAKPSAAKRPWR